MRCLLAALTGMGFAVAIAGCGGTTVSDTERVTQAIHAHVAGDGQRACSQLSSSGQRQLVTLTSKMAKGLAGNRLSCEEAVGLIRGVAGTPLLRALSRARGRQRKDQRSARQRRRRQRQADGARARPTGEDRLGLEDHQRPRLARIERDRDTSG